jgi:diketogulonate reductase-like aldo/keto reductase
MQKTITLNNGQVMPTLGLGTWKAAPGEVGPAVKYALLEAGYRHIDGAYVYLNEKEIGQTYHEVFETLKREDVFITSKLWNTHHHAGAVEVACRQTLADLQLDYLDLYLMHWGVAFQSGGDDKPMGEDGKILTEPIPIHETWEAMENLVKLGLVKSIGVANFTTMMLHDLLTYAKIKPVNNQIELHPYNNQSELVAYCQSQGIAVTAYSPLGGRDPNNPNSPRLFADPLITELAVKYGKSPTQILLNWALSRGTIAIPKSVNPDRLKENLESVSFELAQTDIDLINGLNKNLRFIDPGKIWGIPYFS